VDILGAEFSAHHKEMYKTVKNVFCTDKKSKTFIAPIYAKLIYAKQQNMEKFYTTFHKNLLRNAEIKSRNSLTHLSMDVNTPIFTKLTPTPQLVLQDVYTDFSENLKKRLSR
jgi:hypothetical protein